uniref:Uncharacterized protein n=1 Tax=Pelusios castaneus TaxID=367368 RepID=A0A8C8RPN7_9SAUR
MAAAARPALPARPRLLLLLLLSALWARGGCGADSPAEQPEGAARFPESPRQEPTVLIALLARNAAHALPRCLGCLERLRYPKSRLAIWAATDHNVDNTTEILREWLKNVQKLYHYVEWRPMDEPQ